MDQVEGFLQEVRARFVVPRQEGVTTEGGWRLRDHRISLVDALLAEHQHEPILEEAFGPYLRTIASGSWKLAISNQTTVRADASEMLVRWMEWCLQKHSRGGPDNSVQEKLSGT